jgi:hypothetical protein
MQAVFTGATGVTVASGWAAHAVGAPGSVSPARAIPWGSDSRYPAPFLGVPANRTSGRLSLMASIDHRKHQWGGLTPIKFNGACPGSVRGRNRPMAVVIVPAAP